MAEELTQLAGRLADADVSQLVNQTARSALEPLYQKVLPAIQKPHWLETFSEEYYVFHFNPGTPFQPETLLGERAHWTAGLLALRIRR